MKAYAGTPPGSPERVYRPCKTLFTGLVVLCLTPGLASAQAVTPADGESSAGETGLAIAREVNRLTTGYSDYEAHLTMTLISRDGKERVRELDVSVLAPPDDGERTLLVFRAPRDLSGTALLTHAHEGSEDDQWLYLPAMKRVKRVSGASRSGSFMGSEFSYEDVSSEDVGNFTYLYLGAEQLEGGNSRSADVEVVDRFPVDPGSGYSKQRVYVDRERSLPVRIEYYDPKGERLKTLTLGDYALHGTCWRAGTLTMENERTGAVTRLEWTDFRFDSDLPDRQFTPDALARRRG